MIAGLDGSQCSTRALRWAARFARAAGMGLHVVVAWERGTTLVDAELVESSPTVEELERRIGERARAMASEVVAGEVGEDQVELEVWVRRGMPGHVLSSEATRLDAALVVVGTRGAGGAFHRILGSVSRELTECPQHIVAVVPDLDLEVVEPWKAVVGVDGSAGSSRAVRWCAAVAARSGGEVVAVHAFEPQLADLVAAEEASLAAEEQQRFEEEWCAPFRMNGVRHRPVFERGSASSILRKVGDAERPSCVVLGSRGLGAVTRRVLGSVTYDLVTRPSWPVVVVPAPRDRPVWRI